VHVIIPRTATLLLLLVAASQKKLISRGVLESITWSLMGSICVAPPNITVTR